MKKILLTLGIRILLISMPMAMSISIPNLKENATKLISTNNNLPAIDHPLWAQGEFNGTWAYDFLGVGVPWPALGNISGYYSLGYHWNIRLGHFLVDFSHYNGNNAARLEGWFVGPYLVGKVWKIDDESNQIAYVGIGNYNETSSEFVWRLMAFRGPTFYMWGNSAKFF